MRHTPAVLPPPILSQNFLQSISPSQSASPSVAQYSAGLAHDARNMLAAMDIYCELLGSPGVLKPKDRHLLDELRLLRDSSGKLLDRLLIEALKCLAADQPAQTVAAGGPGFHAPAEDRRKPRGQSPGAAFADPAASLAAEDLRVELGDEAATPNIVIAGPPPVVLYESSSLQPYVSSAASSPGPNPVGFVDGRFGTRLDATGAAAAMAEVAELPEPPVARDVNDADRRSARRVTNVAQELQAALPMLSALAGPRVHVSLVVDQCPPGELYMPQVDLTRVLINLVRNAAEAMSIGGRVVIAATATRLADTPPAPGLEVADLPAVLLSIDDNGPGIPLSLLDRIFEQQVSSATQEEATRPRLQFRPRGLGLRIVRDFVEAGGGTVRALRLPDRGSRFEIVLPMVTDGGTSVRREM